MNAALIGSLSAASAEVVGRLLKANNVKPRDAAWIQAGTAVIVGLSFGKSGTAKAAAITAGLHYAVQALGMPDYVGPIIDSVPLRITKAAFQLR